VGWSPYGTPPPAVPPKKRLSTGAIVGIVIASVLGLLLAAGCVAGVLVAVDGSSMSIDYDDGFALGQEAKGIAPTRAEAELYCRGAADYTYGPGTTEAEGKDTYDGCLAGWKAAK
jgi:hypothetical protein